MTIDEMTAVLQAYREGKTIEVTLRDTNNWRYAKEPSFNFKDYDYRIQSEPYYRPFESVEEVVKAIKEHGDLVIWKENDAWRHKILSFSSAIIRTSDADIKMESAFKDYTFADGTPFGKLVED